MKRAIRTSRPGFTLVEALAAVAILGMLLGLILPAVQDAREAARRTECSNHMRQLGLSVQGYHATHGFFPPTSGLSGPTTAPRIDRQFSVFTQLLPYLDESKLYASINFNVGAADLYDEPDPSRVRGQEANSTARSTRLRFLLCPSDARQRSGPTAGANYRSNNGTWRSHGPSDGPFSSELWLRSAGSATDGLSHTVLFSEKLRGGTDPDEVDPRSGMFQALIPGSSTLDEARAICRDRNDGRTDHRPEAGLAWFFGTFSHTWYNHIHPPNDVVPDCYVRGYHPVVGIFGARSNHPNAVTIGLADGSARAVKDTLELEVWRALGTRNGGEILGGQGP